MKAGKGLPLNDPSFQGLKATIIDFGLSRMSVREYSSQSQYTEFDEVIFDGKGMWFLVAGVIPWSDNMW